jgi:hypothetical protein
MKAIRRSLSPFQRRKNIQELLDDVKAKEDEHMRMLTAPHSAPQIPREGPSIEVSVPPSPRGRSSSRRWFVAKGKYPVENKPRKVPDAAAPDTATTTVSGRNLIASFANNRKSESVPLAQPLRGRVRSRSLGRTPSFETTGSMVHKTRASSLERPVPVIRQVSLTDDSVVDISATLRQMETQLMTARKQGKRVSRAKVMGALLSVVDQLDADQKKGGALNESISVVTKSLSDESLTNKELTKSLIKKELPKLLVSSKSTLPIETPAKITVVNSYPDDEDDSLVSNPSSEHSDNSDSDSLSSDGTDSFESEYSDHKERKALHQAEIRKQNEGERVRGEGERTHPTNATNPATSFSSMSAMMWGDTPAKPATAPLATKPEEKVANYNLSNLFYNSMGMSTAPETTGLSVQSKPKAAALPSTRQPCSAPSTVMCSPQAACASPTTIQVPTKPKGIFGFAARRVRKINGAAQEARVVSPKSVSFALPDSPPKRKVSAEKQMASPERASWFALPDKEAENMKKAIADIFLMSESPPRKKAETDCVIKRPTGKSHNAPPTPFRSTTINKSPPTITEPPLIQRETQPVRPKARKPEPPPAMRPKARKPEPPPAMNDGDMMHHLGVLRRKLPLHWVEDDLSDGSQPSRIASSLSESPDRGRLSEPRNRAFVKLRSFRKNEEEFKAPPSKIVIDASARAAFDDMDAQFQADDGFGFADGWPSSEMFSKPDSRWQLH